MIGLHLRDFWLTSLVSGSNHDAVSQCLNLQATPALIDRFGTEPISWIRSRIDSSFDSDTQIEVRTGFLPDRLLDLRYDPIKLVSREEIENEGSAPDSPQRFYAALSYCWGTGGQLLTTRESLEARRIAISKGKMSPLLWDAIQLTRLLEIPYLWIDALCILQGDLQDWNRQSSIMGLIYRNARVTVAIPSSGGCENGFQRNRRETIHIPFTSRVDPDVSGQLSLRYLNRSFDRRDVPLRPAQISYAEIDESQWASRRWTFQEQYLASRLLLLTAAEIYFCTNSVIMHYPTEFEEEVDLLGPGTSLRIENWYDQVVAGYSKRMGFTLGSDVLPALSGVANIFARHLRIESSDYVAGLWNGSLHIGLAWKITDARAVKPPSLSQLLEALQRPSNYMAPSWSWTSRGAVTFPISQSPSVSQDQQCKHLRASTILSGENAYGEVSSGTLSVTARMADLDGELHQSPERSYFRSTEPWKLAAQNNSAWNFYLDWDPEDDVVSLSKAKMVLLGHGENLYQRKFCFGILLHEARGIHGGKFFRIGYFESTNKGNFANFHVQSVGVV